MIQNIADKIYTIRGQKVILDSDLAEIYGYTTKALNQQVKNNKEKFEGEEFMFQLTQDELEEILKSNFLTSRFGNDLKSQNVTSSWGGVRKLPYAFTEQGIYMLMTVLKGELAVKQSRMLVMAFKAMKDYIVENKMLLDCRENLNIGYKVSENTEKIKKIDAKVSKLASEMVKRTEISPVFLDFSKTAETKDFLLFEGEPLQAKEAYLDIYKQAKKSIYIIDNYVNIKTLHLLQIVKQGLEIVIFTDNMRNYLRRSDLLDFQKERPDLKIKIIKAGDKVHDRYIILDEKRVYQSGGSSKDAGYKMTSIHEIMDDFIIKSLLEKLGRMKNNREVSLHWKTIFYIKTLPRENYRRYILYL